MMKQPHETNQLCSGRDLYAEKKTEQLATGWKRLNSYPLETMCTGMNLSAGVVKINDLYLSFFVDIIQFFVVFFSHGVQQVWVEICYV